jgi:hypothetical protein
VKRALIAVSAALLLLLLRPGGPVLAAAPVFESVEVVQPRSLTVGDHLQYVIKVEADRGSTLSVAPGGLPAYLTSTQMPRFESAAGVRGNGRIDLTMTLELAVFQTGDLQVPPIKVNVKDSAGATTTLETDPTRLFVDSVLPPSGDLTPRDLKPQAEIGSAGFAYSRPAVALVLIGLLAAIAVFAWRKRHRHPLAVAEPVSEAFAGPEDRARAALDLAGAAFAGDRDFVAYYETLALTVRGYLTERFGFAAFALTTRELRDAMLLHGIDRWQARLVNGLLAQCDAVVFAHYRPALPRADADLTAAYEIVEMSRPKPAPEEVAVAQ